MIELSYRPFIIGLGYRARQGKTWTANKLHSFDPHHTRVYGFADALKAHVRVIGLMSTKDGEVLQRVGTDVYRHSNPNFWIEQLALRLNEEQPPIVIVHDVRFRNELDWVKAHGVGVKIVRLNPAGMEIVDPGRPSNHPSETDLEHVPFDYTIKAKDGDLNELHHCAVRLWELVKERLWARDGKHLAH